MENNFIYDQFRLPKTFEPIRYNLEFYIDITNITYEVNSQIEINVVDKNSDMMVLNADTNYKIEETFISIYDHISESYDEKAKIKFKTPQELIQILYSNVTYQTYCNLKKEDIWEAKSNKEKLHDLLEKIKIDFNDFYEENYDYLSYEKFNLIDCLENTSTFKFIEESIYIPIPKHSKNCDKLCLYFKVNGKINLSTQKACGMYFGIFGNDAKLLQNSDEFLTLWRNKETNENLIKNCVITALNEPVDARTYMPCFDEPCFKSKFNIKIQIDKEYVNASPFFKVLSNGDLLDIEDDTSNNRFTYIFSESPLMSIYLMTFVIGRFEYLESIIGKTRLRVYTPVNAVCEGTFAMDIAGKSLEFFQKYFKIPYSFPKLDLVPVPDMDYRAMENWGCIIYLNYALMVKKLADIKERKLVARTNAHEISHMWFGNLVTMEWWEDIWLNEGFARLMEFECLNSIKPEFLIWEKYIELIYQNAMEIDEKPKTHPVRCIVPRARSVSDIFDTISYAKGASILRMLLNYVGKDKFRVAIIAYLEKYQYKNTTTKNLWDTFKETINVDVEPIMDSWLNLSGHPKISVDLEEDKTSNQWYLVLNQSPFPQNFNNNIENPKWIIPIFLKTNDTTKTFLIEENQLRINIESLNMKYEDLEKNKNFIKVNYDMTGFYRVKYDSDLLFKNLLINKTKFTQIDICGLLSDYYAFEDFNTCLDIIKAFKPFDDFLVLSYSIKIYTKIKEICFQFNCFEKHLNDSACKDVLHIPNQINTFFEDLIDINKKELLSKIYLKDSSHYLNEQQDEFFALALYILAFIKKDTEVITYVVENFEKYNACLHKNFKFVIYRIITSYAYNCLKCLDSEKKLYKFILNEYMHNFYDFSLQTRGMFKECLLDFEHSSDELVDFFVRSHLKDEYMKGLYFQNLNPFIIFPYNRKKFIDSYIKLLCENYIKESENENKMQEILTKLKVVFKNIFVSEFSSDVLLYINNSIKKYFFEECPEVDLSPLISKIDFSFKDLNDTLEYNNYSHNVLSQMKVYFKQN